MKAVIGLGFGDEGKGHTVAFLAQQNPSAIVTRFSGGHQAGHQVNYNGLIHIFSNFGSGTLLGNETHISLYCIVSPINLYNEYVVLKNKGINPKISIDKDCMITTPYDFYYNRKVDKNIKEHGTCGMGIGATVERNEAKYTLTFEDLKCPTILNIKLKLIKKYYALTEEQNSELRNELSSFKIACSRLIKEIVTPLQEIVTPNNIILEGSQGLLLDKDIGFFPHVTRSNTGSKNILAMGFKPEYYLVTRAYQTRHGNGPITNANIPLNIAFNPHETNQTNQYQGVFKKTVLDLDLLLYGLNKDSGITRDNLVITCLDQIIGEYMYTFNQKLYKTESKVNFIENVQSILKCNKLYISESDKFENITRWN